jgi:hypothetical protein
MNTAPMLKSGRAKSAGVKGCHYLGCSCCNTKAERRKGKRPQKRAEKRQWRKEVGLS